MSVRVHVTLFFPQAARATRFCRTRRNHPHPYPRVWWSITVSCRHTQRFTPHTFYFSSG